jgi:hypothetical protein
VYVTVVADAVRVQPVHDIAPNAAAFVTVLPRRFVYDVTGKVIVVLAQPPVTPHVIESVRTLGAPARTVVDEAEIPTLAVPAADAACAGNVAPITTIARLRTPTRTACSGRRAERFIWLSNYVHGGSRSVTALKPKN